MKFDETHYVPTLPAKAGEMDGLAMLTDEVRAGLTPLVEVPAMPPHFDEDKPPPNIDKHVAKIADMVQEAWKSERPVFMEVGRVARHRLEGGVHPLTYIFEAAREVDLALVPVTSLDRDDAFQKAVARAVRRDGLGVCLRLSLVQLARKDLSRALAELLASLKVPVENVDLVVDARMVTEDKAATLEATLPRLLATIPRLTDWRTFSFLSGAFPDSVAPTVSRDEVGPIKRLDWALWLAILVTEGLRQPTFADYATRNPDPAALDMRKVTPSATIRYTSENDWYVFRGRVVRARKVKGKKVRGAGYKQFHSLSAKVVEHPVYAGRKFSAGDRYIWRCAKRRVGTGGMQKWVEVATNHHLTYVWRALEEMFSTPRVT